MENLPPPHRNNNVKRIYSHPKSWAPSPTGSIENIPYKEHLKPEEYVVITPGPVSKPVNRRMIPVKVKQQRDRVRVDGTAQKGRTRTTQRDRVGVDVTVQRDMVRPNVTAQKDMVRPNVTAQRDRVNTDVTAQKARAVPSVRQQKALIRTQQQPVEGGIYVKRVYQGNAPSTAKRYFMVEPSGWQGLSETEKATH